MGLHNFHINRIALLHLGRRRLRPQMKPLHALLAAPAAGGVRSRVQSPLTSSALRSVTKCERSKGRPPSCTLSFSSFSPTFSLDSLLLLLPPRGIPAALLASSTTSSFPSHTQRLSHAVAPQAFRSRYSRRDPGSSRLSAFSVVLLTHAFSELDQAPLSKGLLNTSPSV